MKCEFCPNTATIFGNDTIVCDYCYTNIQENYVQIRKLREQKQKAKEPSQPGPIRSYGEGGSNALRLQSVFLDYEEKFSQLSARAGEYFDDYLIITRGPELMYWRSSDDTWALGATKRFTEHLSNKDKLDAIKNELKGEE